MNHSRLQLSLGGLLLVVACVALNFWLFRLGVLYGILGLNVSKHVVIAYLCKVVGVDRAEDTTSGEQRSNGPSPALNAWPR